MALAKICIVGGGPAGFYAAQHLLKHLPNSRVDVIEKLPVPFGLVRYGVAPDHPNVKNVIKQFTKTAKHPNFRFLGNVRLGTDVTLDQLTQAYHSVLLTYGSEADKLLGIAGEELDHVLPARRFVGWYNGVPEDRDFKPNLSGRTMVILGQGNVAIDVARMVLTPVDQLKTTDITDYALDALAESKIEQVHLVGRRGPLQAAFTIKELREMLKIPQSKTVWNVNDFTGLEQILAELPRPRKRITELMLTSLNDQTQNQNVGPGKIFAPTFFRAPMDISKSSVKLAKTILNGEDLLKKSAIVTPDTEFLPCDLVVRSIGYKAIQVDAGIPFDHKAGLVKNNAGRVAPGLYTTGWLATGPTGVILNTMTNAFAVASTMCQDLTTSDVLAEAKSGSDEILNKLKEKNIPVVAWEGWEKIDAYEVATGKKKGKCREKIVDISEMLKVAL